MHRRRYYIPLYTEKYNGHTPIVLKSSWEEHFAMNYCDLNPNCIEWSYESFDIKYRDPLTNRQTIYIPDFLLSYKTPSGDIKTSLIEIKPLHEKSQEYARNMKDAAIIAKNQAKWEAAELWCQRRSGVEFLVLTEAELFPGNEHKKPRKYPVRAHNPRKN
jgi:TnsA endonuclease N terminal